MKSIVFICSIIPMVLLLGCSGESIQQRTRFNKSTASFARLQLGLAYLAQNELKAARQNLERAVRYAPDDYRMQLAMALYAERIGEMQLAIDYYQRALQLSSGNSTVLSSYGNFLCAAERYEEAHTQFALAEKKATYSELADNFESSGYCLLQQGEWKQAENVLSRAVTHDPEKGNRLLEKARYSLDSGKDTEARLLLGIHRRLLSGSAERLMLQIRIAALDGSQAEVKYYAGQLAQRFPQSKEYQQFLANEY